MEKIPNEQVNIEIQSDKKTDSTEEKVITNETQETIITEKIEIQEEGNTTMPNKTDLTSFITDDEKIKQSVRLCVVGNVDSGKSTTIGVLTKGELDNGRGEARLKVFNYPHENQTGRTSSVAQEIMGYDKNGNQVWADRFVQNKNKYWPEVCQKSNKIQILVDLCGHEKYLKTTMYGMVSTFPDYTMVTIGANSQK